MNKNIIKNIIIILIILILVLVGIIIFLNKRNGKNLNNNKEELVDDNPTLTIDAELEELQNESMLIALEEIVTNENKDIDKFYAQKIYYNTIKFDEQSQYYIYGVFWKNNYKEKHNVYITIDIEEEKLLYAYEQSAIDITLQQFLNEINKIDVTEINTNIDFNENKKVNYLEYNTAAKIERYYRYYIDLVQYDTKGNIKYQEILSNPDDAEVKAIKESKGEKGARNIQVVITNTLKEYKHGYRIVLRKHHIDDGDYGELIPGAKFKIEVEQEYGEFNRTWEATTDSEGMITSDLFDGYGNISVKITELDAPEGFNSLPETLETKAIRNKNTGKLSIVTSDTSYDFSENDDILYIDPVNEPKEELYTIIINKADTKTEKLITESQAKFDVKMIGQENVGTEEEPEMEDVETYLGQFGTDNKGKAKIENLQKPEEPGIYKYEITEIKEPNGYVKLE